MGAAGALGGRAVASSAGGQDAQLPETVPARRLSPSEALVARRE